ncbi:MAG: hypothetical protein VX633_01470, partial [Verrucomicrobiota bacterium]|nr:hypothetical protein [Verrucomicrobiota bacterium]
MRLVPGPVLIRISVILLFLGCEVVAESIGINFNSDRDAGAVLGAGEFAGLPAVAQANWNNTNGGSGAGDGASGNTSSILSPSPGVLVDDSGNQVATTVSWSSNGTWNTNNGSSNGHSKLMNGYIDNIGGGGFCAVDFAGIPYAAYDVYVYFGSDGNNRTGWIESSTAGQTFSFNTNSQQGGGFPENYALTEDEANGHPASNYCVFRDQSSSSFSVQVNRGSSNSGIHGIQIVGTVAPGAPTVENAPATGESARSARLNGAVTDIGSAAPVVTIYYGDNDGLTNVADWDEAVELPGTYSGAFFADVTDLSPGRTYYYRAYASNASGSRWALTSETFQTPSSPPMVVNLPATEIMTNSAKVGAEVTATGGEAPLVTIYYGLTDGRRSEENWDASVLLGAQSGPATTTLDGLQTGST